MSCQQCTTIARSWPEPERRVTCSECGAVMERETAREARRRRWTLADLELLARWEGTFYGSGMALKEPVQTSGRDDRGKQDEKTSEWHRAAEVNRRFEGMRTGEGCTHYAVLKWLVFDRGMRSSDPTMAVKTEERRTNKLMEELGKAFAGPKQCAAWRAHKETALRDRLPRVFGQRIYDAAVKAWEEG